MFFIKDYIVAFFEKIIKIIYELLIPIQISFLFDNFRDINFWSEGFHAALLFKEHGWCRSKTTLWKHRERFVGVDFFPRHIGRDSSIKVSFLLDLNWFLWGMLFHIEHLVTITYCQIIFIKKYKLKLKTLILIKITKITILFQ